MSSHISSISRSLNYHLRNIGRIRSYIDKDTCNHAVRSLVLSRIDYCNSLLYGQTTKNTHKLQTMQNRAARLVFKANRREHTTPLLKELHWLPVSYFVGSYVEMSGVPIQLSGDTLPRFKYVIPSDLVRSDSGWLRFYQLCGL